MGGDAVIDDQVVPGLGGTDEVAGYVACGSGDVAEYVCVMVLLSDACVFVCIVS